MAITPIVSNPRYNRQYHVDGITAILYTVSISRSYHKNGEFDEFWCCSCKAWTSTSPRQDCRHILQVKLYEIKIRVRPRNRCPDCGGEGPVGRFIKTGQSGFGDVEGYGCTHEYHEIQSKLNPNWAKMVQTPKRRIKI